MNARQQGFARPTPSKAQKIMPLSASELIRQRRFKALDY